MPRNLILVRHGQSEGNLARKNFEETKSEEFFNDEFLGIHESQYLLTSLGLEQAKKAGEWLKDNNLAKFDRYYVSNNVRAMQTAVGLELEGAMWYQDYNIRERDGGLFNVMPPSKRDRDYADQQKFYKQQPFLFRPPQGESLADLATRLRDILGTLSRECDGKDVIMVCHGHVMRVMRIILERFPLSRSNEYLTTHEEWGKVLNCSIIHYTREDTTENLTKSFNKVRIINPAGGGDLMSDWISIDRPKFTNEMLLDEIKKNRPI